MIKIRYEQLGKPSFQQSFMKLLQLPIKQPAHFRLVHLAKDLQKALDTMKENFKGRFTAEFAVMDEKGNPIPPSEKCMEMNIPFLVKDGLEESAASFLKKYGETEVVFNYKPLSQDDIMALGEFSAQEVVALEPILDLTSFAICPPETGEVVAFPSKLEH